MNQNAILEFTEANKALQDSKTPEELKEKYNTIRSIIDKNGLRGFFAGQVSPSPNGIVLDYDVEEIKKELLEAKTGGLS